MKITKSQLKELIRNAIVEDIMDKEIENPKTGNKIKIKTALQLPDEHPANKKAKDMVAKSPTKDDDEPMDATPADKDEPKGPTKNPFSKESPAFEPKQKQMDKELLIKKSDDIVKQFQGGEYESLEDLVMYASPAEIQEVMEKILEKIPDGGQNFDAANEYWYDLNDHEMGVGSPADYDEDQLKDAREGLFQALTTPKEEKGKKKKGFFSKLNPFSKKEVKESKKRRYTVKEVRMWMKKLEENRYKKVYNSDARRVAWMVNNEGVELSEMPKSMSKKWTKAQYGRERYLANEFIKSKSEQMNEGKLTEAISGSDRKILFILVRDIVRNLKSKIKNFDVNNKSHLNRVGSSILAIIRAMTYSPDNMNYKNFKKYFPKNFNSKLIQKKLKQFHSQNDKVQVTLVTQAIKNELGAGVKEEKLTSEQKLRQTIRKIIKEQLNEKTFGSQAQYMAYRKKHNLKPGSKHKVAGKTVTVRDVKKISKSAAKSADKFAAAQNAKMDAAEKAMKKKKKSKVKEAVRASVARFLYIPKKDIKKAIKVVKSMPMNLKGKVELEKKPSDKVKGFYAITTEKQLFNAVVEYLATADIGVKTIAKGKM